MLKFILQAIKHPQITGAIIPSSKGLAELIVNTAEVSKAKSVVELGSGMGALTERILKELPSDGVFFAFEKNAFFVEQTRKKFPGASIYLDSAANIGHYLGRHGLDACECIISSLPWINYGKDLQECLLDAIVYALSPNGKFLTYEYFYGPFISSGKRFYCMLEDNFSKVTKTKMVWENFPPAFVYLCTK